MASTRLHVPEDIRKEAERALEKHRTKYCFKKHKAACRPSDPRAPFPLGDKVCTALGTGNENAQIWCVVATGKGSKCFKFAPNISGGDKRDTCIVIAPISSIDGQNIKGEAFWTVKYDKNLLRKAPKYRPGSDMSIEIDGLEKSYIIEKYDWKYNGLRTGWMYKFAGHDEWFAERDLENSGKRNTRLNDDGSTALKISQHPQETSKGEGTTTKSKKVEKGHQRQQNAADKDQTQKSKSKLRKAQINRLRKRVRQEQLVRLEEQLRNYKLKMRIKQLKKEVAKQAAVAKERLVADVTTPERDHREK